MVAIDIHTNPCQFDLDDLSQSVSLERPSKSSAVRVLESLICPAYRSS